MRVLPILVFLLTLLPLRAEEVRAFWISPDWLLPGDRRISHEEARALADRVVRAVKSQGGNTIFLETLMRGQLIGPCVRLPRTGQVAPAAAPLAGTPRAGAWPAGAAPSDVRYQKCASASAGGWPAGGWPAGAPGLPAWLRAASSGASALLGAPGPVMPPAASGHESATAQAASEPTDDRLRQVRDQYRARVATLLERHSGFVAPSGAAAVGTAAPGVAAGLEPAAPGTLSARLAAPGPAAALEPAAAGATVEAIAPSSAARAAGARVAEAQDWVVQARARSAARVAPATPSPGANVTGAATPGVIRLSAREVEGALPVYPLCEWDYAVVDGWPQDLLSLFIEAGRQHGVAVHAWVHCFYWKSDNESFRKPWQDGPSLWDDLLVEYLERAAKSVRFLPRQRALAYFAHELARGFTWNRFIAALDKWGAGGFEGRFQGLIQSVTGAEGPAPDFLLTNIRGDLHYPMEMDRILALYLNPADPRVSGRVERVIGQIVASHPGLAGVHLDHVRYQKWPYGGPGELAGFPKDLRISYYDIPRASVAGVWPQMQARREAAITRLVQNIRNALPSALRLSAAVYPTYYAARSSGSVLGAEAYICQDWARWPVDFVVPMIYNPSLPVVQKELAICRSGGAARAEGRCPAVYPGVSSLGMAKNWRSWAFFDFQGLAGTVSGVPGSAMRTMGLKDKLL